jgi:hypothetical protein
MSGRLPGERVSGATSGRPFAASCTCRWRAFSATEAGARLLADQHVAESGVGAHHHRGERLVTA